MKTKILSLALTMALVLALFSAITPALAITSKDSVVEYLVIGLPGCTHDLFEVRLRPDSAVCHRHVITTGEYNSELHSLSGNGWAYDVNTGVITLDNFSGSGIFAEMSTRGGALENTLTIKLGGVNKIDGPEDMPATSTSYAINVRDGNLQLQGPGTLVVNANRGVQAGASRNPGSFYATAGRIGITHDAAVTITAATQGLMAHELTVNSKSSLVASKTNAETTGVPVGVNFLICNGTVIGTNSDPDWFGIQVAYSHTIGSNVTAYSGERENARTPVTLGQTNWPHESRGPYMALIETGHNLPGTPATPPPASGTQATPYPNVGVTLDGAKIPVEVYGIDGGVYLKLSDLASAVGINATWDGAVQLDTTKPAAPSSPSGPMPSDPVDATPYPNIKVYLNGAEIPVNVYGISGSTILSLRDVAAALGLTAKWENSTAVLTR